MKNSGQVQIVVDGMTGTGKTTAVNLLSQHFKLEIMPEEFLDQYDLLKRFSYNHEWCLPMQLNFLVTRYSQYLVASESINYIFDRSIYSDTVYADMYHKMGYLSDDQFESYLKLYQTMMTSINEPKCVLFLICPFEEVMERIVKRGRQFEIDLGIDYWRTLYSAYANFVNSAAENKLFNRVLVIDTSKHDLLNSSTEQMNFLKQVDSFIRER